MTDTRLPDTWLGNPRFDKWEPETWKFFIDCLMWSNRFGTDGHVPMKHALALSVGVNLDLVVSQMEQAEVCERKADHIAFFWLEIGQSSAAEVEERRRKNRDKQRNLRAKKNPGVGDIPGDIPGDIAVDITGYVGQDRLGEEDTF